MGVTRLVQSVDGATALTTTERSDYKHVIDAVAVITRPSIATSSDIFSQLTIKLTFKVIHEKLVYGFTKILPARNRSTLN